MNVVKCLEHILAGGNPEATEQMDCDEAIRQIRQGQLLAISRQAIEMIVKELKDGTPLNKETATKGTCNEPFTFFGRSHICFLPAGHRGECMSAEQLETPEPAAAATGGGQRPHGAAGSAGSFDLSALFPEPKKLRLEVGKRYRNRLGDVVGICTHLEDATFPFGSSKGIFYKEDGRYFSEIDSCEDLIEVTNDQ
jgi:hypothetical protein